MPAGIKVRNVRNATLSNNRIRGFDTGFHLRDVSNLQMNGNTFDGVMTPFDADGVEYGHVEDNVIINDPKIRIKSSSSSKIGWRKPKGPPLPILCPNCKAISSSKNYVFGMQRLYAKNNAEICPECRKYGAILSEGLFELTEEIVRVLKAPDITYAMLQAIANVGKDFHEGTISAEDLTSRLSTFSPRLKSIIEKANLFGQCAAIYVSLALSALSLYYAAISANATVEQAALAREQAASQSATSADYQKDLERILEALANVRIVPNAGEDPSPPKQQHYPRSKPPAKNEAPSKPSAPHLGAKRTDG